MDEKAIRESFAQSDEPRTLHPPIQAIKRTARRRRTWTVGIQGFAVAAVASVGIALVVGPMSSEEDELLQQSPEAALTCPGNTHQTTFDYWTRNPGWDTPEAAVARFVDEDAGEFTTVVGENGARPTVLVHREDRTVLAKVTLSKVHGDEWQPDTAEACAGFSLAPARRGPRF